MSRKRTGMVEAAGTWPDGSPRFKARLRLGDGTKTPRFVVDVRGLDEDQARAHVAGMQAIEDAHGALLRKKRDEERRAAERAGVAFEGESGDAWFARYTAVHARLGNGIAQHPGDWKRYASEWIGKKAMTAITAEDVKAVRDNLTRARLEGRLSGKRCLNVWSRVIKAPFSRAWHDDDPRYGDVRIGPYAANPALGIKPPVSRDDADEDERERQALEPDEAIALLAHADAELEERRYWAVLAYAGITTSEAHALRWADVRTDGPRRVIKVHRARDMKSGEDGSTKTRDRARDVPIHPSLLALLRLMREGKAPGDRVFPLERARDAEKQVQRLRASLTAVGVTRPELHEGTATLRPFDVRSLRTTFATWCSMAGYDSAWIAAWLGHKPTGVTQRHYVKDVPSFDDVAPRRVAMRDGSEPFPPLPTELLERGGPFIGPDGDGSPGFSVRRKGLEDPPPVRIDGASQTYRRCESSALSEGARKGRDTDPVGPTSGPGAAVDVALARALDAAVARGDLELVSRIVEELRARRLEAAGPSVVSLAKQRPACRDLLTVRLASCRARRR